MRKEISYLLIISLTFTALACGNTYSALANKTTDDAIYEDVQKLADQKDWAAALTQINSLSASKKSQPDVIETWAGLLAGQCGLDFITYFNTVSNGSLTGSSPLKFLMNAFTQTVVDPGSCQLAQLKMEEISTDPASRTQAQNIFMAVLGMVKIGVYLRSNADKDGMNNLGDGSADATYNSCNTTSISDADVTQVLTGIGLVSGNSSALSAVAPSSAIASAMAAISTSCGATCAKTDASTVTGTDVTLMRDILRTGPSATDATYQLGIDDVCNPANGAQLLLCCP